MKTIKQKMLEPGFLRIPVKTKKLNKMKTIKLLIISAVALLFVTTGCMEDFTIRGNGIAATEGRITNGFDAVKSEGAFDVHITNGDEFEVVLNAETNILQYIETDVNNGTLRIHIRGIHNVKNRLPMEVYITTPNLEGIKQSGSGIITTDYFVSNHCDISISGSGKIITAFDAPTVDASISGSGKLEISGISNDAKFDVSGSGRIDAFNLELNNCRAIVSGSGNIWVNVERFLTATISGSGNIYYTGEADVETRISGSGNVIREN